MRKIIYYATVVLIVIALSGCESKEPCPNTMCNEGQVRTIESMEDCSVCTPSTCDGLGAFGGKCACGSIACINAKICTYGHKECETCGGTGYVKK